MREAAGRLVPVGVLVVLMWLVTAANFAVAHGTWNVYGVRPHDPGGFWPNLLVAPFLHAGTAHLVANTVPLLVLGSVVALQSSWRFMGVTLAGALVGAVVVWLLAPAGTVTIGASGLVFAYFGWLLARAVRERSIAAILLGLAALAIYGGVLWGLSPFQVGISWQGHLGGLLGGLGLGWLWPVNSRRALVAARSGLSV